MAKSSDGTLKTVFKIEGEAEYTRAVKNINSELRVLSSEMKEVDSRFDKNEKSMRKLKAQNEVLNKQYDTQTKKVSTLKDAVANSTKAYDNAVDVYNEMVNKFGEQSKEAERAAKNVDKAKDSVTKFSIELNKAQADLNKTEAALKENNKELRNLKNIKLTDLVPDEMVEKVEELQENFKKVTAAANGVASACGKAALEAGKLGANTLKGTLEAGTKALTAYASAASAAATAIFNVSAEAGLFADDINTLAKQTGLDTSTLQEYTYAASLIDVEVETIAKSMAKLTKNMTSTSSEVQGAFDTLGVSIRDNVTGELRNNEEVFNELITALGKVENETQRDNLAMQIFGKSAQDLNPLILGGAEQLTELAESAKNAGLILSQDTLDSLNAFNDSIDVLKGNLTASGRILASTFSGDLQKFTDKIGKAIPDLSKAVSGMFDPETAEESEKEFRKIIRDLSEDIGRDIEGMLPTFLNAINGITSSVIEVLPGSVMALLPYLIDGLTQLVTDLVHQMPTLLPQLAQGAVDLFMGIISGFNTVIAELNPLIPGIINDVTDILVDNLPLMIATSYQLFIGLISGLTTAAPEILKAVGDLATTAASEITKGENLNALIQAGIDLVAAIAEGLPQALPQLISALGTVISDLLNAEVGYDDMKKIGEALGQTLTDAVGAALGVIDSLLGTNLEGWYNDVVDFSKKMGAKIYEALNQEKIASIEFRNEYDSIDTDIMRAANQYMREGYTPEEALEKAKADILDTIEKQAFYDTYLGDASRMESTQKQYEVLLETGQIGKPNYYSNTTYSQTATYYEQMGKAAAAEKEFTDTVSTAAPAAVTTAGNGGNTTTTEINFYNSSPKALSAHEQLMQNARQATVAAIYTGK